MKIALSLATVLGLALALLLTSTADRPVVSTAPTALADDAGASAALGKLTISDVMVVANAGPNSLSGQIKGMLKGSGPDGDKAWKQVASRAQVLATLAELMKKQKPGQGSAESWKKQTNGYAAELQKLAAAAKAENLSATQEAAKAVGGSCKGCHKPHK